MSAEAWRRSRTDVAPRSFAWQAWHFRHPRRDLRGRRGTFCTTIDVIATLKLRLEKWQAQRLSNSYLKTGARKMAGAIATSKLKLGQWQAKRLTIATLKLKLGKWQAQRLSNSYLKTGAGTMAGAEVEQ